MAYIISTSFPFLAVPAPDEQSAQALPPVAACEMSALQSAEGDGARQHALRAATRGQSASDDDEVLFVGEYAPLDGASRSRCVSRTAIRLGAALTAVSGPCVRPSCFCFQAGGGQRRSLAPPGGAARCFRRRRRVWWPSRATVRGSLQPLCRAPSRRRALVHARPRRPLSAARLAQARSGRRLRRSVFGAGGAAASGGGRISA